MFNRQARIQEIARALRATAAEMGWSPTRIAAEIDRAEKSAQNYLTGDQPIGGPELLHLLHIMPGLQGRLIPNTAVRGAA